VPVRPAGQKRLAPMRIMLRGILQSGPDVVHFQWPSRAYERTVTVFGLPLAIKLLGRIPRPHRPAVVMTFHESTTPTLAWNIRYAIALLGADGVIRVAEEVVLGSSHRRIVAGLPTAVIPIGSNIFPTPHNGEALPLEVLRLRDTVPVLLVFFGLVTPEKRLERILSIIRAHPDIGLAIVGGPGSDDGYYEALFHTVRDMSLTNRVVLTGWLPPSAVSKALQLADAVVVPNVRPNSGALLAAVQHGRPVFVFDAPAVQPGGWPGPPPLVLQDAVNSGLRQALASWDYAAALPPLTPWPDIAHRHVTFYRKVLRHRTKGT
jgi:glycosyltransferase involved in cell wall biosynthesis